MILTITENAFSVIVKTDGSFAALVILSAGTWCWRTMIHCQSGSWGSDKWTRLIYWRLGARAGGSCSWSDPPTVRWRVKMRTLEIVHYIDIFSGLGSQHLSAAAGWMGQVKIYSCVDLAEPLFWCNQSTNNMLPISLLKSATTTTGNIIDTFFYATVFTMLIFHAQ